MNAPFLALEERGHVISWPKKDDEHLSVGVDGEPVAISMLEVIDSEKHGLTPVEQKHPWMAPKWDYKLTGCMRSLLIRFRISQIPLMSFVHPERKYAWL